MASSPTDLPVHYFAGDDGAKLAWRETGEGRPVVLIHGLFSDACTNWIRYGHAARIAACGYRVIMPDLRGHGDSAKPHDAASYPPDVLVDDGFALLRHLGLTDHDLGGYSLGSRTVMRMLVRGAAPGKAIVSGMGLEGLLDTGARAGHFRHILSNLGTFARGSAEWTAEAFLKTTKGDPLTLLRLLDSFVDSSEAQIRAIATPTLIVTGEDDHDNGSSLALAEMLRHGRYVAVPGNHMSAVVKRELGEAIAGYLGDGDLSK